MVTDTTPLYCTSQFCTQAFPDFRLLATPGDVRCFTRTGYSTV